MDIKDFDGKCIKLTTDRGEVYEGTAAYHSREYVMCEYGRDEEALQLVPILFFKDDIADIESLEDVNGPYGHFSEKYGLLERKCLEWGTDMIEEILDPEDDVQILRMLACMDDRYKIRSNRESGDGRYDISLMPRDLQNPGVIMELKSGKDLYEKRLEALSAEALKQIDDKGYDTEMREEGIEIVLKLGIAFSGKKVSIRTA